MDINEKIKRDVRFEILKDKDPYLYNLLRERYERAVLIHEGLIVPLKSEKKYITKYRIYGILRENLNRIFDHRSVDSLMSWQDTPEKYKFWRSIKDGKYTNQEIKEKLDEHFFRPYNENKAYNLWI